MKSTWPSINAAALRGFWILVLAMASQVSLRSETFLVARYDFNEGTGPSAADSSGNGRTLTLLSGMQWTALGGGVGGTGYALYNPSTAASGAAVARHAASEPSALNLTAYTITGWFKTGASPGGHLLNIRAADGNFRMVLAGDRLQFFPDAGRYVQTAATTTIGEGGQWVFFAFTVDSAYEGAGANYINAVKVYLGTETSDGLTLQSQSLGGVGTLADFELNSVSGISVGNTFGAASGNPGNPNRAAVMAGIDDIRIYSGVLGEAELDDIRLSSIPEPSAFAFLLGGSGLILCVFRRLR